VARGAGVHGGALPAALILRHLQRERTEFARITLATRGRLRL